MKKISLYCFAIYLFFGLTPAFAGGGQSYPNGAEGFLSGAVPPPGFYLIDYLYNYSSDSMKDNKGDDIEPLTTSLSGPMSFAFCGSVTMRF